MRQRKQRDDLTLLRISLDWPEDEEREDIVFELSVHGDTRFTTSVAGADLGLPEKTDDIRRFSYTEPVFHLPEEVGRRLERESPPSEPLWLELNPTGSRLAIVPWERLLKPNVQSPILRLPVFQSAGALTGWDSLDVVLCTSSPVAKERIPFDYQLKLIEAVGSDRVKKTTLHLFTDSSNYKVFTESSNYEALCEQLSLDGRLERVQLYDPKGTADLAPSEFSETIIDDPQSLVNPWLNWISDALGDLTVDEVHFACHGFFSMGQGSIAVAESPLQNQDSNWARFIGAQQLNNFLNRVGAEMVCLHSLPYNYSISGLRLLADQLARLRRGIVLLDSNAEEMSEAQYLSHMLYCALDHELLPSGDLTLYCSPDLLDGLKFRRSRRDSPAAEDLPALRTIAEILHTSSKEGNAWIASSYRWLEEAASALDAQPISERQSQTQQGIRHALKFLSDVTQRHASLRNRSGDQRADGHYEQEAE